MSSVPGATPTFAGAESGSLSGMMMGLVATGFMSPRAFVDVDFPARFCLSAILAGQVGSSGECLRWQGVSEKMALTSVVGSVFSVRLALSVQFVVILPCH